MKSFAPRHDIVLEIKGLLSLGLPITVTQLLQVGYTTVAVIMAGRVGATELAAVGLGAALWIFVYLGCMGLLLALSPIIAQHHGAEHAAGIRRSFQQGLWLALIVGVIGWWLLGHISAITRAMKVDPNVIPLVENYLEIAAWSMPPTCFYFVFRFLCEGTGHSRPMMIVQLFLLPLAVFLNWALIFGNFGSPALGVRGAALSSTVCLTLSAVCMGGYMLKAARFRHLLLFRQIELPDLGEIGRIVRLGLPIAVTLVLDSGFFSVLSLVMGRLGDVALAAHQVAINYSTLVFMIPVGLSHAIMVRVGQSIGRRQLIQARFRGCLGIVTVVTLLIPFSIFVALAPELVIHIYTRDSAVVPVAAMLLAVAVMFVVMDGVKIAGEGALRGLKETTSPMVISLLSYWLVGFPAAWLFGIFWDVGPVGLWYGMVLGMTLAAMLMIARYLTQANRLVRSSVVVESGSSNTDSAVNN
jgi:MATE family multidrug resistance protein